jgi:hypothetical protein
MLHSIGVPLLVDLAVEGRRQTAGRAATQPVHHMVQGFTNGRPDPASTQVGPIAARAVRLVGQHPIRGDPGRAVTDTRHPDPGLPRRDQYRQRPLTLLASQVQFRRGSAGRVCSVPPNR